MMYNYPNLILSLLISKTKRIFVKVKCQIPSLYRRLKLRAKCDNKIDQSNCVDYKVLLIRPDVFTTTAAAEPWELRLL